MFSPEPAPIPTVPVDVELVAGEAQQALGTALATVTNLLDLLDGQPVTPRKDGGFPVGTRRLAKQLRVSELEAVFWVDLTYRADLISYVGEATFSGVCPTTDSDDWRDLGPHRPAGNAPAGLARHGAHRDQLAGG